MVCPNTAYFGDMLALLSWFVCKVREEWFNDPERTGRFGLQDLFLARKVAMKPTIIWLVFVCHSRIHLDPYHKNLQVTKVLNLLH